MLLELVKQLVFLTGYISQNAFPQPLEEADEEEWIKRLQQGDAEAAENGTGSIAEESKGFDFSVTLGTDFKIAKDKETGADLVEIKLQGNN